MSRIALFIVWLLFFAVSAHATDSGVFVPYSAHGTPPNLNNNVGDNRTINCFYYLPAATYQGSALNNPNYSASVMPAQCTLQDVKTGVFVCTNLQQATVAATCAASNSSGSNSVAFNWQIGSTSAVANGYFVDCAAGNNGNSGTDYLHPWLTLSMLSGLPTSSDAWIKQGTTCANQTLNVNWSGTANDPVIIGTYYVSAGVAYQDLPTNAALTNPQDGLTYGNGARATIQGPYQASCRVWVPATSSISCPVDTYSALVYTGHQYVTFQDLVIRDAKGIGLQIDGGGYCAPNYAPCEMYTTIQRVKVTHTRATALWIKTSRYAVVRETEIEYDNLSVPDTGVGSAGTFGVGLLYSGCDPCRMLIENNWVHENMGESISGEAAAGILVRGNRVANDRRVAIYSEGGADVVVEQNILAGGTVTPEPGLGIPGFNDYGPAFYASGMVMEPNGGALGHTTLASQRLVSRNNLIANYVGCLILGTNPGNPAMSGRMVGNTCIGAAGKRAAGGDLLNGQVDAAGAFFQNNVLASTTGSVTCTNTLQLSDHNYWSGTPSAVCQGAGDIYSSNFADLNIAAGTLATADATHFPVESDFLPTAGSAATHAAATTTATFLVSADWDWVLAQRQWKPGCSGGNISQANWIKTNHADYCDVTRDGTWIGARKPSP